MAMRRTPITVPVMSKPQRYPMTPCLGLRRQRPHAHHNVPATPANARTTNRAMLDVIRSARNPVVNVLMNTSVEGTSTTRVSGSKKTRSTCWIARNSSHQNTPLCFNDHSNMLLSRGFPLFPSRPAVSQGLPSVTRTRKHVGTLGVRITPSPNDFHHTGG